MVTPVFHKIYSPVCKILNDELVKGFQELTDNDFSRRSHNFHGRYENLYLDPDKIPGLRQLLDEAKKQAANLLNQKENELVTGFWLNAMQPGHITGAHTHDDDDEQLSGVYYVHVPENSGDLVLTLDNEKTVVTPEEGMFIFFSPSIEHEVTENKSSQLRLSIAFNFGQKV